ncbi:MAG: GGDEF domain-containing protein [Salibacteraceae bacterium]|jgi:GGDEF domain-containing protein
MVEDFEKDQIIVDHNVVTYHQNKYFIVELNDKFKPDTFTKYDVILVDVQEENLVQHVVSKIRTHLNPRVYLIPIFLLTTSDYHDVVINNLVDGVLPSINRLDTIESKLLDIRAKIERINHPKVLSFESQMINRTLNLMYTRNKKVLEPIPYFHSGIGYYYPELSINFNHRDESGALKILNIAEQEGLFQSEFHERVYLCNNCNGGYLNYREVCPKCNSSDSKSQDLVHHFPCAYVGPIEDFQNKIDDQLDCPKCNKTLRHIGVDYDKPSVLYTCNSCHHRFQDYYTKAKCTTCSTENDVEHLVPYSIKRYIMTKKGENVAINGYINIEKQLDSLAGTVTIDIFKVLLQYETQRLHNQGYQSNLGYLHIERAAQIAGILGLEKQKSLMNDLVQMLRSNLNPSDFVSFYNSSTIIFSFVDTSNEKALETIAEMVSLSNRLISKSFEKVHIELKTDVRPLKLSDDVETAVNSMVFPLSKL